MQKALHGLSQAPKDGNVSSLRHRFTLWRQYHIKPLSTHNNRNHFI